MNLYMICFLSFAFGFTNLQDLKFRRQANLANRKFGVSKKNVGEELWKKNGAENLWKKNGAENLWKKNGLEQLWKKNGAEDLW